MGRLNHGCRRYPSEAIFIEKICSNFSDAGFAREYSSPERSRSKRTYVVSRIVGRESLLIDGFENCQRLLVWASQEVCATGAVVGELGLESLAKSELNFLDIILKLLRALH